MLSQLTSMQFGELLAFFEVEGEEKERIAAEAQEARLRHFFSKVAAQQRKEDHG